jgi:hypothetical protein
MTDEDHIVRILRDERRSPFEDAGDDQAHLPDELVAQHVVEGRPLSDEHLAHFVRCAECRQVVAVALKEADASARSRRWVRVVAASATTLALAAGLAIVVTADTDDGLRRRGERSALAADLTVVAVDSTSRTRELMDGDRVGVNERVGFRYGNPAGRFSTLTVLGWDGERVHWYYPEKAGGAPARIAAGEKALSIRLPFDVKLDDHRPGPLWVVSAFDEDPDALARRVRREGPPEASERTGLVKLVVTSSLATSP